jgi:hypothetical protein
MAADTAIKLPIHTMIYRRTNKINYHKLDAIIELYAKNSSTGYCTESIYVSFQ